MLMLIFSSILPGAWAAETVAAGATPALNTQSFHPSMDSHEFFRATDSDLGPTGFGGRGVASYTLAPLQYTYWDGTTVDIVANLLQVNAVGTYTDGPFRIGIDLPIMLRAFGGTEDDASGLGDLAIDAKLRLLDNKKAPLGLALSARTALPTSTTLGERASSEAARVAAGVSLDKPIGKKVDAVLNIGVSLQPEVQLENVTWGNIGSIQAGLAYSATERTGVVAELYTAAVLADIANEAARPAELLVGGWHRFGPRAALAVRPGVAIGLNDAVTTPKFRAILGVSWSPLAQQGPPDADKDGIGDGLDRCADIAEDLDGYEDTDGCPELASLTVKVVDTDGVAVDGAEWAIASASRSGKSGEATELPPGAYEATANGTAASVTVANGGPVTVEIRVPAPRGTLAVTIVDKAGKPVAGAVWTATGPTPVPETGSGSVQARPGNYTLSGRAPGYRTVWSELALVKDGTATLQLEIVPAKAALVKEKIEIKDSVYFETGKAIIKPESLPLLDEVAEVLRAHPELTKVRVEGNTDGRGPAPANQTLSQSRAESVRAYLVGKGVAVERLDAIGYGESKPLVKEKTAADQAKNRRVDFFILTRSDAAGGPTKVIDSKGDTPTPTPQLAVPPG